MTQFKNEILNCVELEPKERTKLFHGIFYKAERYAFKKQTILKSFADVGLHPWDPEEIIKNAKQHSPMKSQDETDSVMRELIDVIKVRKEERISEICKTLSSVKCATISSPKMVGKGQKRRRPEEEAEDHLQDEVEESSVSESAKNMDIPLQPPAKRRRKKPRNLKKCCVKGCDETHFWSKKWGCCPKCKKKLLPFSCKQVTAS